MVGYYRLDEEQIKELPSNSINIEENIYEICCPLIIGDDLPKDLYYLYNTLEVPIIEYKDYKNYDSSLYKELEHYLKEFSQYLKLNIEIELLEEGKLGHLLRVGKYAKELCNILKIPKDEAKDIYIAGLFHDVGKTQIPKKILSKPAKLTPKEFEIMKAHSLQGVEILKDFLNENTLNIIASHHERCDKSGYPKGIVPGLGAKIIAIADSYDAMLSNRVYKKNKTLKSAQEELVRCTIDISNGGKGILYDEKMVRAFVKYHGYGILKTNYNKRRVEN